ncbi:PX-SNX-like domain protein (macronuclear) [Tetrahymena thermophila SB210]|uniref:PX-SNX-like domain protein n=1 Tax=Tetrahymena thermophila (strain SB210) TaxID=312017 RepID=Q229U4_TETTS|nr:PX-SNX-like domain protein [Tetrahymena thermophila SB210]EAR82057.1 PX-SNX-like domain protein [Tetrahymena thermophila SB210]|eukprot:XP_001029720.1 PX-SNX-like domain protein [Tetrahymena thermophila SB210]
MDKKKESSLTIKFKDFFQDVNGVTFFKILVYDQKTEETWEFEERYSAMRDIHKALREQCKVDLPDFPTKKWFGNTDKNFLSQRKATLQTYFTTILSILDIQKYPILKNFFYRKPTKADQKQKLPQSEIKQDSNKQQVGEDNKSAIKPKVDENKLQQSNNQNGVVSEKQKQEMRAKEFADKMNKISEKVQNKFIINLSDQFTNQDEGMYEQKRAQINKIKLNLNSNLLSTLSLPTKFVEKPDLNLKDNINHSKIVNSMNNLNSKLLQAYEQNIKSYSKFSSQLISGKTYNMNNQD